VGKRFLMSIIQVIPVWLLACRAILLQLGSIDRAGAGEGTVHRRKYSIIFDLTESGAPLSID